METEGIKYAGSKREIIPFLLEVIRPLGVGTVLDGFSGTTRVSQALKKSGYTVIANDISEWSSVFGVCYLQNRRPRSYFQPLIDHLNRLPGKEGWFNCHYGGKDHNGSSVQEDGKKRVWQIHNTMKLDAIREEIDRISEDPIDRSVLLTSLILAMDRVDSSLGHQASYLKKWSARSYGVMKMAVPKFVLDDRPHEVFQEDIFNLLQKVEPDLAYFDPPYGSSNNLMPPSRVRYASYYHLWKTVCLNDRPAVTGAANRRTDVSDQASGSLFEDFRKDPSGEFLVLRALERLIAETRAKNLLLSYNNYGRATVSEIVGLLNRLSYQHALFEIDYRENIMSGMTWTGEWERGRSGPREKNKEFLFLIRK